MFLREFDRLSTLLADWKWSVLTSASTTVALITSDAPVAVLPGSAGGWRGILPAGSQVFIPINSRQLILGEPHPLGGGDQLDVDLVRAVNAQLAVEAYDAVFADPSRDWPDLPTLTSTRPHVPTPTTVTWSRGDEQTKTFPVTYPEIADSSVQQLIDGSSQSRV